MNKQDLMRKRNDAMRTIRYSNKIGSHRNCFTGDMTILTLDGWKRFDEIADCEVVATRSNFGFLEYHKINKLIVKPYSGNLLWYDGVNKNFMCTPNHDFLDVENGKIKKFRLSDLIARKQHFNSPLLARWNGNKLDITLDGEYNIVKNHVVGFIKKYKRPNVHIKAETFAKLLALYLAEGNLKNYKYTKGIEIAACKPEVRIEIKEIIREAGFNPSPSKNTIVVYSKELLTYFKQYGKAHQKYIPRWLKNQPTEIINYFLEVYLKCDGCYYKDSKSKTYSKKFYTVSKQLAEGLQELIIKTGKCATIRVTKRHKMIIKGKSCNARDIYSIYVRKSKTTTFISELWKEKFFEGNVYCVNVKNNTILVNKNNPFWTGNCIRINVANSLEHEITKLRICYDLIKEGKEVFTEAIFDNGSRADILVLDDYKIIEVLCSEGEGACLEKSKKYPELFELEMVKVNK